MTRRPKGAPAEPAPGIPFARRMSREQVALHGSAASSTLGMGMVVPILPSYAASLGATETLVGLLIAAFAATRLLVALPAAWLAGRIGHRRVLVGSPAITVPAALLCAAAGGFWTLGLFCVVEGALAGTSSIAGNSLVLVDAPEKRAGRAAGSYQAAGLVGASLGPLLGGLVGGYFGVPAVFIVYAGLTGLTAIWLYLAMDPQGRRLAVQPTETDPRMQRSTWRVLVGRDLWPLWLLAFALAFARVGTQLVAAPFIGVGRLGLRPEEIGVALSLGGLAALAVLYPAGWLADTFGRKAVIVVGGGGSAAALLLLASADAYVEFLFAALLFGIASGLAGPAPAAHLAQALPVPQRTLGLGVYRSAGEAGAVLAPAILGWSASGGEFELALFGSAGLVVISATSFAGLVSVRAAESTPGDQ